MRRNPASGRSVFLEAREDLRFFCLSAEQLASRSLPSLRRVSPDPSGGGTRSTHAPSRHRARLSTAGGEGTNRRFVNGDGGQVRVNEQAAARGLATFLRTAIFKSCRAQPAGAARVRGTHRRSLPLSRAMLSSTKPCVAGASQNSSAATKSAALFRPTFCVFLRRPLTLF